MSSIATDHAQRRDDSSELVSAESTGRTAANGDDVSPSDYDSNNVINNHASKSLECDSKTSWPEPGPPGPSPEVTFASRAIQFFATATPGTLAGLGVGVSAVTYAVLGRLGLVLIGAFGGVVSFIIWESKNPEFARAIRGEDGPRVLDRVWTDLAAVRSVEKQDDDDDDDQYRMRGFDDFRPETREALSGLVDAIVQNYIKWWYNPLVPSDHAFPLAVRKTITSYLLAISNRMSRKRPADAFLDLLTNSTSMIIVFLSELATAFAELPPDTNVSAADTIYNYLAENPDSRLANLLNKRQQATKFKMVSEDLLGFLDKSAYNCDPARIFLREVVANSVLEQTLQQCSRAEWINGWIVYLLEAGEPNLNQAIDVGMQTGRDVANNVFADLDGNVGNIGIAKPRRGSNDQGQARRKESSHKKKLSKADEELEGAMEEMKRMNAMIAEDDMRRKRASTLTEASERSKQSMDLTTGDGETQKNGNAAEVLSPTSSRYPTRGASVDGVSTKSDTVYTPHTPRSTTDSVSQASSPQESKDQQSFTSFDQIVPPGQPESDEDSPKKAPLTLHNASFTLHDDGSGDMGKIKSKPNTDYLIQVEPSSSHYPGWMIVRRYSDFETLHEILRRIAAVSGATAFMELHKELPSWKNHTRESLRGEMERYLRDACWYQALAESEGMKRFLEKSQGHTHGNSKSFGWETMGKNMLEVLAIGPKGAMEGGKSLVGGVFGNLAGLNRKSTSQSIDLTANANRLSISSTTASRVDSIARSPARSERASLDSQRSSVIATQPGRVAPMERMLSFQSPNTSETDLRLGQRGRVDSISTSMSARPSREHSRASSLAALRSPSSISLDFTKLPPPPDEISDDYESNEFDAKPRRKDLGIMEDHSRNNSSAALNGSASAPALSGKKSPAKPARQYTQLSEAETRVAVELIFAVINEMYTLSSAWNIRRTLLTAAKSFLLRPGNPSLLTVQSLIQASVIDANTSDAGIASGLRKVRENTMPTEQEQASWPAALTEEDKKQLAIKARRLLIQSGVPAALMGVMGQSATGEALGRVFDCLQIEEVARGLIFGLILQAVRVLTH
ncbi:PXA domain-containing protein [Trichoderma barbatum]